MTGFEGFPHINPPISSSPSFFPPFCLNLKTQRAVEDNNNYVGENPVGRPLPKVSGLARSTTESVYSINVCSYGNKFTHLH